MKRKPTIADLKARVQELQARLAEQERVEATLAESQRVLSTLISNLQGMVYRCRNDRLRTMLYLSEQVLQLTGYPAADLVGNARISSADLIHPEDRARVWEVVQEALKARRPFQTTFRITAANGEEKWLWDNGQGVYAASGELIAIEGYITDITRRKRTEEHSRLLSLAIEQTSEGIAIADLERRLLFVNQAFALAHGYTPQEVVGKQIAIFHTPEQMPVVLAANKEADRTGSFKGEVWHVRRDGTPFPAYMDVRFLRDDSGGSIGVIGTLRDLTEQRRAEEERARLENQLYQIQKLEAIGQLAGGVAHDFNNLLAVILGNASIVQRDSSLPPKVREAMLDIVEAAERGSSLTHQLLAYARGGLQKPVATDLNRLIRSMVPMLERAAPSGIEFRLDLAGDLPTVVADPPRIEQIVMNLCLNALQASQPPARIGIVTRVVDLDEGQAGERGLATGQYVLLQVIDQGCGIALELRERIFEPFFTTREMGRGMGLSVAHGMVQSHRGHIAVESELGRGSTFSVWLPASNEPEMALQPSTDLPRRERPPRGSETILIVDDEAPVARTIEQMASSLGYCAVSHGDADSALAFLEHNAEDIDLVLCDVNMPERNGWEIAAFVGERCPHVAVVLTSGDEGIAETEARLGVAGFLHKPFTLMSLAKVIRAILDSKGPKGGA
ncbi:MAG TPA: PAS domain S-box protein [Phycisphaerae bacterium]|nr:PAS domain S-box protein [Phycisphaerae bacterium]HRY67557.1 PAS domain S-box protein [Phycisphaerae bacterium]HSA24944.1 PAS domain S-box protein [Phycisphaerae bacterium]